MNEKTKIITITLNPSLDRTLVTHFLSTGYHNQTREATRLDPAGEGLNIARALAGLGCRTHAVVMLGDDPTARAYRALAADESFEITILTAAGGTRTNTIILDTGAKEETQITEPGAEIRPEDILEAAAAIEKLTRTGDVVVFAGALPPGAPEDTYARLIETVHASGAVAALVRSGSALAATLPAAPDLVALTQLEMEGFFNHPVREMDDIVGGARRLRDAGAGRVLIERREAGGALLVSDETIVRVGIPEAEGGTTSGVWAALVAGYLAGRATHQPLDQSMRLGAAAANYTATQVGNEFGSLDEVSEYAPPTEPPDNQEAPREAADDENG